MRVDADEHTRRAFLRRVAGGVVSVTVLSRSSAGASSDVPVSGNVYPELASFDALMTSFIAEHKIPGAALAVARQGRLVYARGFGFGDVVQREPVQPRSLFRIASISKSITGAAVLRLVDRGQIKLDEPVFDLLDVHFEGKPVPAADGRLKDVTVRHLLQHTGGWNHRRSFDPMFRSFEIARDLGVPLPVGPNLVIRYMWKQPLDFRPGARYVYSNFGYCLLGRVIEKVSGVSYEEYVRRELLAPLDIHSMRIGRSLLSERVGGEVHYYGKPGETGVAVVGPELGKPVPWAYGGWYQEALDAHGGWIASAPDLVRFASTFDVPSLCPFLSAQGIRTMFDRPEGRAGYTRTGAPKDSFYGCGWSVRPSTHGGLNTWHNGSLDGTSSLLVRRQDGLNWAVLFNTRVMPGDSSNEPALAIDGLLHEAANAVPEWPRHDLFVAER